MTNGICFKTQLKLSEYVCHKSPDTRIVVFI